jgi:hypothetical protein
MSTATKYSDAPPAARRAKDGGPRPPGGSAPGAAGDYLDRFRQIVTMIELLDHLPDLARDIADPRGRSPADRLAEAPWSQNEDLARAFGELSPLMQRAFQAVTAGLDKLAESAVDLYDHTHQPPTPDEIKAGAEIGRSMRQLLDRAMALVETGGAGPGEGASSPGR